MPPPDLRAAETPATRIVVLNVDDYEAGRYATSRVLRAAGFDVLEAASGEEGLQTVAREADRLALVLLDVNLPDVNGFEVCRRIKSDPRTSALPVLYLSAAYRTSEHRVQGLELGADGYLTQPVEPRELVATVNALLRAREVDEAVRRSEARFRTLVSGTSDVVWTTTADGRPLAFDEWRAFTGARPEEAVGDAWMPFVHPEDRARVAATWARALATGSRYEDEYRLLRADGEYRVVNAAAVPVTDAEGAVREWIGRHVDVTETHREEDWERLFGDAGVALASSIDAPGVLPEIARLAVGPLAAWCAIDLAGDDGLSARAAEAAVPSLEPAAAGALAAALPSGRPLPEDGPAATTATPEAGSALAEAGVRSLATAHLVARGHLLGVVTLAATRGAPAFDGRDAARLGELARRLALALDNARLYATAVHANAAKGQFLAVMSHELRTPLNAIIGYADLLDAGVGGPLSASQHEHLARIRSGSGHLLRLIEDVLLFSRLEAGREQLVIETADLNAVVADAAALVEPLAQQKKLAFRVHPADGPVEVRTDVGKVHQIVLNLFSNSVKFTDEGSIEAHVERTGDGARITVTDTGIGIAPEHLERIFEAFSQVEQTSTRRVGGTGLGLSVTRNLARLLGGDVEVASRFPGGSTFTVHIPRRPPPSAEAR